MSATQRNRKPALNAAFLRAKHSAGLPFDRYLETDPERGPKWRDVYDRVQLDTEQQRLVRSFSRDIKVIVSSGIWCGDCVQQGPLLQRIADANPDRINLRWLERDEHLDLAEAVMINQGLRVPVVLFMAEDFEPVSILGDRTLSRYRALAARMLGPSCPLPGADVPPDELNATLRDWLREFERVHLLLRLSGRLRNMHGD